MTLKSDVSKFLSAKSSKEMLDNIFEHVDVFPSYNERALKRNFQLTALYRETTDYGGLYTYLKASRPYEDDVFVSLYGYESSYSGMRYMSFNFVKMEKVITYRFVSDDD